MRRWHRRRKDIGALKRQWERFGVAGPWLWAVLGIAAALLVIWTLDGRLRPVVSELAVAEVHNAVTEVIMDTVTQIIESDQWSYDDMVSVQQDEAGRITALQSNVVAANLLRSKVVSSVLEHVSNLDVRDFDVALGSLFDVDLFSGRGPSLKVRTIRVGTVEAEFESVFSSAGINQTKHQIILNIAVPVTVLIAASTVKTEVTVSVCVAETVIVGQVPDTYLGLPSTS